MKESLLPTSTISYLEDKLSQYDKAIRQTGCIAQTIDDPDKKDALLYKTRPILEKNFSLIRETVNRRLSQRQQQLSLWLAQNPKGPYRLTKVSEALGYKGHPDLTVSRLIRQAATNLGLDGTAKFLNIPTRQSLINVCEEYEALKNQQKRSREKERLRLATAQASPVQPAISADSLKSAIVGLSEEARSILAGAELQKIETRFGYLRAGETNIFSFQCSKHGLNSVTVAIPPEYLSNWSKFVDQQPSGKCTSDCHKILLQIERLQPLK